jgi:large subunit ribosomal protein L15e
MRFLLRVRCWEMRQMHRIVKLPRTSRPGKARMLGFKAKQGYVIYRVAVRRGGRKRPLRKGINYGKPKTAGITGLKLHKSKRAVAEGRVGRLLPSLRILNSYWVNQDSVHKYYEVILVDPFHPVIRHDPRINWICDAVHKRRESRGLTSAGRKHRGLHKKGHRANYARPSRRAVWKRHNQIKLWRYR